MNIHWIKTSIRRDVFIAFAVICLAYAYCQRTLLEDNPYYVQRFVSKMMSKFPVGTEKPPRDVTGMEKGPNLGYEPYWIDVPDLTWDYKCKRCPKYYERYKTVCAIDSTGEVLVNISMCNLLRQNCLRGTAYGHASGTKDDFKGEYFAVDDGWAHVSYRGSFNAIIQLSTTPDNNGNRYMIRLDGWAGWWNVIYKNGVALQWYRTPRFRNLNPDFYTNFMMRWNSSSGWFLITTRAQKNWTMGFHLNITDPEPFPIKYIAVGGIEGYGGDWIIRGFIMTRLGPCAEEKVGQPLVTSGTEASLIIKNVHKVNKAYFARLHEVGLDKENISFHTREEY